jgi:hypothetical protein
MEPDGGRRVAAGGTTFATLDQVVELIGAIAGYNMVSRFLVATGVEKE